MTKTLLRQAWCRDVTDHKAHTEISDLGFALFRCPGRYTPSRYHAPHASPAVPSDPFAGIDTEDE
jgi:hypothetical protein